MLEARIVEREGAVGDRRARLAAREASRERSPLEQHRERVRELEAQLARARTDRDAARVEVRPGVSGGTVMASVIVLGALVLAFLWVWAALGGMPR